MIMNIAQKLCVPGACKGGEDYRVLDMADKSQAFRFLAQGITGDEQELEPPANPVNNAAADFNGTMPGEWGEIADLLEQNGFSAPVFKGTRANSIHFTCGALGGKCPCCGHCHEK